MGLSIHVTQSCSALDANSLGRIVYEDRFHCGKINYQTVVTERTAAYVMPAASDCCQQIGRAPEINRSNHVGNTRAPSDYFGTFADACIPDPPSLVVADIRWLIDPTVKSRPEGLDIDIGHGWHSILLHVLPRNRSALGCLH
jgi:hypothetical protein